MPCHGLCGGVACEPCAIVQGSSRKSTSPFRAHDYPRKPRSRAGKNRMLLSSANAALTQMPTRRNGNAMSHTNGNKTSTANASGHEKTNKMHQIAMRARNFTRFSFLCRPTSDELGRIYLK